MPKEVKPPKCLQQTLEIAKLLDKHQEARTWCRENGVLHTDQLLERLDDLAAQLDLSRKQYKLLRNAIEAVKELEDEADMEKAVEPSKKKTNQAAEEGGEGADVADHVDARTDEGKRKNRKKEPRESVTDGGDGESIAEEPGVKKKKKKKNGADLEHHAEDLEATSRKNKQSEIDDKEHDAEEPDHPTEKAKAKSIGDGPVHPHGKNSESVVKKAKRASGGEESVEAAGTKAKMKHVKEARQSQGAGEIMPQQKSTSNDADEEERVSLKKTRKKKEVDSADPEGAETEAPAPPQEEHARPTKTKKKREMEATKSEEGEVEAPAHEEELAKPKKTKNRKGSEVKEREEGEVKAPAHEEEDASAKSTKKKKEAEALDAVDHEPSASEEHARAKMTMNKKKAEAFDAAKAETEPSASEEEHARPKKTKNRKETEAKATEEGAVGAPAHEERASPKKTKKKEAEGLHAADPEPSASEEHALANSAKKKKKAEALRAEKAEAEPSASEEERGSPKETKKKEAEGLGMADPEPSAGEESALAKKTKKKKMAEALDAEKVEAEPSAIEEEHARPKKIKNRKEMEAKVTEEREVESPAHEEERASPKKTKKKEAEGLDVADPEPSAGEEHALAKNAKKKKKAEALHAEKAEAEPSASEEERGSRKKTKKKEAEGLDVADPEPSAGEEHARPKKIKNRKEMEAKVTEEGEVESPAHEQERSSPKKKKKKEAEGLDAADPEPSAGEEHALVEKAKKMKKAEALDAEKAEVHTSTTTTKKKKAAEPLDVLDSEPSASEEHSSAKKTNKKKKAEELAHPTKADKQRERGAGAAEGGKTEAPTDEELAVAKKAKKKNTAGAVTEEVKAQAPAEVEGRRMTSNEESTAETVEAPDQLVNGSMEIWTQKPCAELSPEEHGLKKQKKKKAREAEVEALTHLTDKDHEAFAIKGKHSTKSIEDDSESWSREQSQQSCAVEAESQAEEHEMKKPKKKKAREVEVEAVKLLTDRDHEASALKGKQTSKTKETIEDESERWSREQSQQSCTVEVESQAEEYEVKTPQKKKKTSRAEVESPANLTNNDSKKIKSKATAEKDEADSLASNESKKIKKKKTIEEEAAELINRRDLQGDSEEKAKKSSHISKSINRKKRDSVGSLLRIGEGKGASSRRSSHASFDTEKPANKRRSDAVKELEMALFENDAEKIAQAIESCLNACVPTTDASMIEAEGALREIIEDVKRELAEERSTMTSADIVAGEALKVYLDSVMKRLDVERRHEANLPSDSEVSPEAKRTGKQRPSKASALADTGAASPRGSNLSVVQTKNSQGHDSTATSEAPSLETDEAKTLKKGKKKKKGPDDIASMQTSSLRHGEADEDHVVATKTSSREPSLGQGEGDGKHEVVKEKIRPIREPSLEPQEGEASQEETPLKKTATESSESSLSPGEDDARQEFTGVIVTIVGLDLDKLIKNKKLANDLSAGYMKRLAVELLTLEKDICVSLAKGSVKLIATIRTTHSNQQSVTTNVSKTIAAGVKGPFVTALMVGVKDIPSIQDALERGKSKNDIEAISIEAMEADQVNQEEKHHMADDKSSSTAGAKKEDAFSTVMSGRTESASSKTSAQTPPKKDSSLATEVGLPLAILKSLEAEQKRERSLERTSSGGRRSVSPTSTSRANSSKRNESSASSARSATRSRVRSIRSMSPVASHRSGLRTPPQHCRAHYQDSPLNALASAPVAGPLEDESLKRLDRLEEMVGRLVQTLEATMSPRNMSPAPPELGTVLAEDRGEMQLQLQPKYEPDDGALDMTLLPGVRLPHTRPRGGIAKSAEFNSSPHYGEEGGLRFHTPAPRSSNDGDFSISELVACSPASSSEFRTVEVSPRSGQGALAATCASSPPSGFARPWGAADNKQASEVRERRRKAEEIAAEARSHVKTMPIPVELNERRPWNHYPLSPYRRSDDENRSASPARAPASPIRKPSPPQRQGSRPRQKPRHPISASTSNVPWDSPRKDQPSSRPDPKSFLLRKPPSEPIPFAEAAILRGERPRGRSPRRRSAQHLDPTMWASGRDPFDNPDGGPPLPPLPAAPEPIPSPQALLDRSVLLEHLDLDALEELSRLPEAPNLVFQVLSSVYCLLGDEAVTWEELRRQLSQQAYLLLSRLEQFDVMEVQLKMLQSIRTRLHRNPGAFSPEHVATISPVAGVLCSWVNGVSHAAASRSFVHQDADLLSDLEAKHIAEIASFVRPPALVGAVLEHVHLILGVDQSWASVRASLRKPKELLEKMMYLQQETVNDEMLRVLHLNFRQIPQAFDDEQVGKVNATCSILCRWVNAVCARAGVQMPVIPRRPKAQPRQRRNAYAKSQKMVPKANTLHMSLEQDGWSPYIKPVWSSGFMEKTLKSPSRRHLSRSVTPQRQVSKMSNASASLRSRSEEPTVRLHRTLGSSSSPSRTPSGSRKASTQSPLKVRLHRPPGSSSSPSRTASGSRKASKQSPLKEEFSFEVRNTSTPKDSPASIVKVHKESSLEAKPKTTDEKGVSYENAVSLQKASLLGLEAALAANDPESIAEAIETCLHSGVPISDPAMAKARQKLKHIVTELEKELEGDGALEDEDIEEDLAKKDAANRALHDLDVAKRQSEGKEKRDSKGKTAPPRKSVRISSKDIVGPEVGEVDITSHDAPKPKAEVDKLKVTILKATGLKNTDGIFAGKSDPYCVCSLKGKVKTSKFQTKVLSNDLNPRWDHTGELSSFSPGDTVNVEVWDKDVIGSNLIGSTLIPSYSFYPKGFDGDLTIKDSEGKPSGTISVRIPAQADEQEALKMRRSRSASSDHNNSDSSCKSSLKKDKKAIDRKVQDGGIGESTSGDRNKSKDGSASDGEKAKLKTSAEKDLEKLVTKTESARKPTGKAKQTQVKVVAAPKGVAAELKTAKAATRPTAAIEPKPKAASKAALKLPLEPQVKAKPKGSAARPLEKELKYATPSSPSDDRPSTARKSSKSNSLERPHSACPSLSDRSDGDEAELDPKTRILNELGGAATLHGRATALLATLQTSHDPVLLDVLRNVHTLLGKKDDVPSMMENVKRISGFLEELKNIDIESLPEENLYPVLKRKTFMPQAFDPSVVVRKSSTCAVLSKYVNAVLKQADQSGRSPKRRSFFSRASKEIPVGPSEDEDEESDDDEGSQD